MIVINVDHGKVLGPLRAGEGAAALWAAGEGVGGIVCHALPSVLVPLGWRRGGHAGRRRGPAPCRPAAGRRLRQGCKARAPPGSVPPEGWGGEGAGD